MFEQAFTDTGVVYKNVSAQLHSWAGEQWAFSFNFFFSLFSISSFDHFPSSEREGRANEFFDFLWHSELLNNASRAAF